MILLTKEKPFECTPLEAIPTIVSPTSTFDPSINFDFSTTPTEKPAMSYSSSAYIPGISAVSPPIRAQPAKIHPSATPLTICSICAGWFLPTAT